MLVSVTDNDLRQNIFYELLIARSHIKYPLNRRIIQQGDPRQSGFQPYIYDESIFCDCPASSPSSIPSSRTADFFEACGHSA
jgi:hypothetical protein